MCYTAPGETAHIIPPEEQRSSENTGQEFAKHSLVLCSVPAPVLMQAEQQ